MGLFDSIINVTKNLLGTSNESLVKAYRPLVAEVAALEPEISRLDDGALRQRAHALRDAVRGGRSMDDARAEAFALAREAADRRLGMWPAVADAKSGFEDWGDAAAAVTQAREQLAAGTPAAEIDLPVAVYDAIRAVYPESVPPFRMRAHDVQVIGAGVLHDGRIAEMKTGEGKTLVASLAAYLNALPGTGVHVVTVNEYLATRDAEWNEPTFAFLGVQVAALKHEQPLEEKKAAYEADITYGTNNEFGFDYLRDNLKQQLEDQVQTRHTFAIVDEVDSVLIDSARTPLIISGPAQSHEETFRLANGVVRQLEEGAHYEIELKDRTANLTEEGVDKVCELLGIDNLYESEHMHLPHFIDNALRAHYIFVRDKDYLVTGGEVKIVDEFTGRVLSGRRWSDGLHQSVEAKEGVRIQEESQTYASITLQNFFRLYGKLAGMTGTALTEADEFNAIYKLEVVAIPTNKPVIRGDHPDLIYGSEGEKFDALAQEVAELHGIGQPILVGTVAVETSERLSNALKKKGVPHEVLNARQNANEATIIAKAGQLGAVTIATNMAGRGTDIKLGTAQFADLLKHWKANRLAPKRMQPDSAELDEAVVDLWAKHWLGDEEAEKLRGQGADRMLDVVNRHLGKNGWPTLPLPSSLRAGLDVRDIGGLRIVGTERHEARRIDNQLRGRSGRQGDPGSSRFYLSLDDDLMKRFAGPTMAGLMRSLGLKDGVPIESKMVSRAVEKAQKRVEEYHFGNRKNLLEYDQVMNVQRTWVYTQRQQLLRGEGLDEVMLEWFNQVVDDLVQESAGDGTRGPELEQRIRTAFQETTGVDAPAEIPVKAGGDACREVLMEVVTGQVEARKQELGPTFPVIQRFLLLDCIDRRWKDHLYAMDHLRHAISLEGYGQRDPKLRYKEEGYKLFVAMQAMLRMDVTRIFFRVQVQMGGPEQAPLPPGADAQPEPPPPMPTGPAAHLAAGGFAPKPEGAKEPLGLPPGVEPGPDDPCPCGSGRKYRDCHGVF